ncbi:MAG TPA: HI0074 family nucleotidyltransferase substrate-binding subunit [Chroococcales cyanobacterium]|jgi:nucleotidyltransferase substrate binding protein (TIGR01987 family)
MKNDKATPRLQELGKSLGRLGEALEIPLENPLAVDGTIQRFEFTFELFWKTLKAFLELEGLQTATPREALKKAFQIGWLQDEAVWLRMIDDRNLTSHVYREAEALAIYGHIRDYFSEMKWTYDLLRERSVEEEENN